MSYQLHKITITIFLCCFLMAFSSCVSIKPLVPQNGQAYPVERSLSYDIVPKNYVGPILVPVSGVRGNPHEIKVTFSNYYDEDILLNGIDSYTENDGYYLYEIDMKKLLSHLPENKVLSSNYTIKVKDINDNEENIFERAFRIFSRSDKTEYLLNNSMQEE